MASPRHDPPIRIPPMNNSISPFRKILSNFAKVFSGQMAVAVLLFFAFVVNTRALSLAEFGTLVTIQAICELVALIVKFQVWQPFSRFGAQALELRDGDAFRKYIFLGLTLDLGAAIVATGVCLAIFYAMNSLGISNPEYLAASYFYTITILAGGTGAAIGVLRVTDKFGINIGINVASAACLLASAIVLAYYQQPLTTYLFVIPLILVSSNIILISAGLIRGLNVSAQLGPTRSKSSYDRRNFVKFAFGMSVVGNINAVRQRGEQILISIMLGEAAAGLYAAAFRIAGIINRFAEAGRQSVYPEFAKLITASRTREARKIALRLTRTAFLVSFPFFLVLIVFGDVWLTLISGPEYSAAHPNLIWLSIGTLAYTLTFGLEPYVQIGLGAGRFVQIISVSFFLFLVGAVTGPVVFGAAGAGLGAALFGSVMVLLLYRQIYAAEPEMIDELHSISLPPETNQ